MRNDRRNYAIVGAFVLAMAAALVVWIALMTGRTGATDGYFVLYDDVTGLKPGVTILYQGYPVGYIDSIAPHEVEGRRRFRVDLSVQRGWRIPADSLATITAPGLLAAYVIDIREGASEQMLEPGAEIPGRGAADVLAAVNSLAGEVEHILDERIGPIFDELADGMPRIVANLEVFTKDLTVATEQINAVLEPANVERVASILRNLEGTTEESERLLRELGVTRGKLDGVVVKVDALLDEDQGQLGLALEDLQHSLAAVAAHIDAIAAELEATTRNASEFSRQIRNDPSVLLRGRETGNGDD